MQDAFLEPQGDPSFGSIPGKKSYFSSWSVLGCFFVTVGILITVFFFLRPPVTFPTAYFLRVSPGETLFAISLRAEQAHLVRSARLIQLLIIMQGGERTIRSGDYYFDEPVSAWVFAKRLSIGDFNITPIRITFPEGMTVSQMAKTVHTSLPAISAEAFLVLAKNDEGKLFPDTYFFSPASTAEDVYQALHDMFESKMKMLSERIAVSGRTEHDILVMASLIERESNGKDDRGIISGILWKRLDQGMLLQVDAPFYYLLGKSSSELTKSDLKIDSPYNTYVYRGLPPTPIGAAGLAAIEAAISPEPSPYLFYLHDKDGIAHYAKTFSEHQKNINQYLK